MSCNDSAKKTISQINAKNPDLVIWDGDLSYVDANIDCFISNTQNLHGVDIAVIGNHEDSEDGSSAARIQVIKHWGLPDSGYYAKNYANGKVLFIGMDTQNSISSSSNQFKFVKNALEQNSAKAEPAPLVIVAMHKPILSCKCDHAQLSGFSGYHDLFKANGVDLVLQGHNHNVQTYKLIDNVQYIVIGSGGRSHYDLTSFGKPVMFSDDTRYGFYMMTANFDTGKLDAEFITNGGSPISASKFTLDFLEVSAPPPPDEEICGDGIDNDGDGQIDEGCPTTPPPPEPGDDNLTEVGIIGVTATTFQDPNKPENTVDNDLNTRWSAEGNPQSITYQFNQSWVIPKVGIAFYKGDARTADFDINGQFLKSAGNTTTLQNFTINEVNASSLTINGHGNSDNDWNSLTEVKIFGSVNGTAPPPEPPPECPVGTVWDPITQTCEELPPEPEPPSNATHFNVTIGTGIAKFIPFNNASPIFETGVENGTAILPKP